MQAQWKKGMSQELVYLAQCHATYRTSLGFFLLLDSYCRLHAAGRIINVEVCKEAIQVCKEAIHALAGRYSSTSSPGYNAIEMTTQELLRNADVLAAALPHSWTDADHKYDYETMVRFCAFLGLSARQLEPYGVQDFGDSLPPEHLPHIEIEAATCLKVPLSTLDMLQLAHCAYPDQYPLWWTVEKEKLISMGEPEARVPPTARPKTRRKSSRGARERNDSPEDNGNEFLARWIAQQAAAIPATPNRQPLRDFSPMSEETPERRADWSSRLYDAMEITRTTPVSLRREHGAEDLIQDDLSSTAAAELEHERWVEQQLARLTLSGWRVRLITPEVMTEALGC